MTLANGEEMEVMARIYRQPLQAATLHQFENGMYVSFREHNQLKGSLLPGI
jgi:tRNA-specific 2-thiouridylase